MNLLIVTQKIHKDDDNLGFFHRWVEEFAKKFSQVTVITNFHGISVLPVNVSVYSLGKEKAAGQLSRLWKFWELFSHHYARADAVFFHMAPEFVLAAAPFLLSLRIPKPSALWYTHKSVTRILKLAEKLVDYIFTASELSFRLPSKKVIFTGHAIDTRLFEPISNFQNSPSRRIPGLRPPEVNIFTSSPISKNLKIVTVGRISPVKDIETIIRAGVILKNTWNRSWVLSIVGGPLMPRDEEYFNSLKKLVQETGLGDRILFYGARPYTEIPEIYNDHDIFISMSSTGSIDKSVLEAMASGLTVLTANEAFESLLPPQYFLEKRSPEFLAERIKVLADEACPNSTLRELVVKHHSLDNTIQKIVEILSIPL